MLKSATVEEITTYRLTATQIEDIILHEAGIERGKGVTISFDVRESIGDPRGYDGGYSPARLEGVKLVITKKTLP